MRTERGSRPVAVITGAGSPDGIGFACARRLAEEHAVVIASTTERIHDRAKQWAVDASTLSATPAI
jgi:3-oxoacyl-[acyl-carrier protein] reductase